MIIIKCEYIFVIYNYKSNSNQNAAPLGMVPYSSVFISVPIIETGTALEIQMRVNQWEIIMLKHFSYGTTN